MGVKNVKRRLKGKKIKEEERRIRDKKKKKERDKKNDKGANEGDQEWRKRN